VVRLADGHMKLVGGDDAQLGVAIFPPILMANDHHFEGVRGFGRGLGDEDYAGGSEKKNDDDEDRKNRPGELDLGAAVNLRRLPLGVATAMAVTDEGIEKKAGNDKEDDGTDGEDQHREPED